MIDNDLLAEIAAGVARREYSLLLGAGSSVGAHGGNGSPLPTGPGMRDELIRRFSLPSGAESAPLQRVFGSARSSNAANLLKYLKEGFTNCTPTWHGQIAQFQWERIWTLNIDDVVERALELRGRNYTSVGWRLLPSRPAALGSLEIVHLHGTAKGLEAALRATGDPKTALDELMFDLTQYGQATAQPGVWHSRFSNDFVDRPFIIVGARLVDELDLWQAISRGSLARERTGLPSVIVLKECDDFARAELKDQMGLDVIEATAGDFFEGLKAAYDEALGANEELSGSPVPAETEEFFRQFVGLRRYEPTSGVNSTRFYSGWAPDWYTIRSSADVPLELTEDVATRAVRDAKSSVAVQRAYVLHGGPGSGKSAALLRIAERAIAAGLSPWLSRGDEAISDALLAWARAHPSSMFFVDDCADFAPGIGDALVAAEREHIPLTIVCAVREDRLPYTQARIPRTFQASEPLSFGYLSDTDTSRLIDKLDQVGRLGRITGLDNPARHRYFLREHGGQLFTAMATLEGGDGFVDRLTGAVKVLDEPNQTLVRYIALAHNFGLPLRASLASELAHLNPVEVTRRVNGSLAGLVLSTPDGLQMSHRVTASMIVQATQSPSVRFDAAVALALALSPHVDRKAIATASREHRLSRELLYHGNVKWLVGAGRSRAFYEALESSYGWNGRFWDQRALLEVDRGELHVARSYAEKSVAIYAHPYAFTTLGSVLMDLAELTGSRTDLRDGIRALREARDWGNWRGWQLDDFPFTSFFNGVLRYLRKHGTAGVDRGIRTEWFEWVNRAQTVAVALGFADDLVRWQQEWLERMGDVR